MKVNESKLVSFPLGLNWLSNAVFCCLTGRVREATPLAPPHEGGRECPSQKVQLRTAPLDGATVLNFFNRTSRQLNFKEIKCDVVA